MSDLKRVTYLQEVHNTRGVGLNQFLASLDSLRLPFCLTVLGIALTFVSFGSRTLTLTDVKRHQSPPG